MFLVLHRTFEAARNLVYPDSGLSHTMKTRGISPSAQTLHDDFNYSATMFGKMLKINGIKLLTLFLGIFGVLFTGISRFIHRKIARW